MMRMCQAHWNMLVEAISDRGLDQLSSHPSVDRIMGEKVAPTFDPLLTLNHHFCQEALNTGGLYMLEANRTGENGGHYCPLCEFTTHCKNIDVKAAVAAISDQMAKWCRAEGLLPRLS